MWRRRGREERAVGVCRICGARGGLAVVNYQKPWRICREPRGIVVGGSSC